MNEHRIPSESNPPKDNATMIIPAVDGMTCRDAAIAYTKAGFRTFPLELSTKRPVPGFDWDGAAWTTESDVTAWWGDSDPNAYGIGLPQALNGLVCVDVDYVDRLTDEARRVLQTATCVQRTRVNEPGRGHFIWTTDQAYGNSTSKFPSDGVDIRGTGYVAAAPTPHSNPEGCYRWETVAPSPLPDEYAGYFVPAGESVAAADEEAVQAFLEVHTANHAPTLLQERVKAFLADTERMPRNEAAARHFGETFREARAGCYPAAEAWDALRKALDERDPYEADRADRLLSQGVGWAIETSEEDLERLRPFVGVILESGGDKAPPDGWFWESRTTLRTIRQAAKARMIGPYGLLGAVLVDVIAATPYTVEVDTYGDDTASLNLYIAMVGRSGAGKSKMARAVRRVINIPNRVYWDGLRSGEGLVSAFVRKKGNDVERIANSAVVEFDEIDRLKELKGRQGATLISTLNTAWVGHRLGGRAASKDSDLSVDGHRTCLVAGVQPGRAEVLLTDADSGTPQRYVWLPAWDPQAARGHAWPDPIEWSIPPAGSGVFAGGSGQAWTLDRNMTLPERVLDEWQDDAVLRARGLGDDMDSHKYLATVKLAAGLALLEMRGDVNEEDWVLAQHLMSVSMATRRFVQGQLSKNGQKEDESRGRAEGVRRAAAREADDKETMRRVTARVESVLTQHGDWMPHAALTRKITTGQRDVLEPALDALVELGKVGIREIDGQGQAGTAYRWE